MSDPTLKPQYATFKALVSVYANDPAAAESELDRIASTVDPSNSNANGAKIFALTSEARIALHNRHFDVAQRAIDQVRGVYRQQAAEEGRSDAFRRNGEVNIAYWEGMLAARRGDYAAARAKAKDIMTLVAQDQSPRKNEPAHELLALADFLQGNFQSAADHYAEANPDDVYLWYYRGLALDGAGRKAEAKEFFERAMTDFNPVLLRILAQKPDVISVLASPAGSVGLIIKQARELGFKGRFIHIGQVDTSVVANIAGKANVEGMWVHGFVQTPLPERIKSWQTRYTKKYGEWNATSIDFANPAFAFVAAVKKAQSVDPKKVADALSVVEFDNLWGKAHFGGKDYYGIGNQIIYPMPFSEVKDGVATLVTQLLPPHN